MENLRDELLDVISGALPETEEMENFCEGAGFSNMLNKVMVKVKEYISEALSDVLSE